MHAFRSALFGFCCAAAASAQLSAPDQQVSYGIPVDLSPADYPNLVDRQQVSLPDFALPDGRRVTLDLQALRILAPGAQLVEVGPAGQTPMADPPVALFRGTVRGEDTRVFLSVSDSAVHGFVRGQQGQFLISSGPPEGPQQTIIFDPATLPAELQAADPFVCAADELMLQRDDIVETRGGLRGGEPCRVADIAIETDHEYQQIWGNSADATSYAVTLMAAISEIYKVDTNMSFQITFLRIWNSSSDPWTENGGTADQLFQFQDYWNLNETGVSRHVAHFLSGRGLGGGVAYGGGACFPEFDYGLSANLGGAFPYPLQLNSELNWDLIVVAHELGHNFGAPHTHDIAIDGCGNGDCTGAENGTLMSYCHLCPGGLANMALQFHPTMLADEILPFMNSGACDLDAFPPTITDDPDDTDVCAGSGFTLTGMATLDGNPTYQWELDGVAIPGATSLSYTVASAAPADAGVYELVVTNDCGSATSAPATVTICAGSPADVTGDCVVDLSDLAQLLANFGMTGATLADGDISGDGNVDLTDLAELLAEFGEGC